MFFKNTKSIRALIFLAAASLLTVPYIAKAQWDTGSPPTGLTNVELDVVLENIVVGILGFIGILGILYLVYGGIRYVTSAGNDSDMEEAKKIIMYAILGLFLTASAYAIVKTVIAFAS
ncbi:pilin [Patescibacteria group bacterium]|nr:pilin [Patescibacteria group bacterium]